MYREGPIHDTDFQLQPRSPTQTATRLARVWAQIGVGVGVDQNFLIFFGRSLKSGLGWCMGRNDQIFSSYKLIIVSKLKFRTSSFYFTDNRYFSSVLTRKIYKNRRNALVIIEKIFLNIINNEK